VGLWIRMHPATEQNAPQPSSAPAVTPPPAETAPETTSATPAEAAPAQASEENKPATEVAPASAAPKKRAHDNSAAAKAAPPAAAQSGAPPPATADATPAPAAALPVAQPAPSAPAEVVLSKLDVECHFPFSHGTLDITVDGKAFLQEKLEEKRNVFTAGITTKGKFEKKDNAIPVGQHAIHVHIASKDGKHIWDGETTGIIQPDHTSRLKIVAKEPSKDNPGSSEIEVTLESPK